MRSLITSLLLACTAVACSAPPTADSADEAELGSVASPLATECSMTRAQILASASSGRREAVERGFAWLDDDVPYSQSASHDGYRTDCSGFVSMCWDMGRSSNTASLYAGDGNTRLGSYDDLVVADALVKQGHVVLFLGWNDDAHEGACVLEQASTASDMQFRVRTTASLKAGGYKAIRSDTLTDTAPAADDETTAPATSKSVVTTQSDMAGDPGDPDEDANPSSASTGSSDDDSTSSRKRRSISESDPGGCSTTPRPSSSTASPLLVVLGIAAARRRRRRTTMR